MIRYFQNRTGKFFTFIIALQILNMSIDSPNAQLPPNSPNADNFNFIDTYVEFVAEVVLKYENAIPETKNRPQKEWQMQKQELVCQKIVPITIHFFDRSSKKVYYNFISNYAFQFVKEINPPPPKSC